MDDSRLSTLPAELRNEIWELALVQDNPVEVLCNGRGGLELSHKQKRSNILALTRTCRAIRNESKLIFYHANIFSVRGDPTSLAKDLQSFELRIGNKAFNHIPKFTLVSDYCHDKVTGMLARELRQWKKAALAENNRNFSLTIGFGYKALHGSIEVELSPDSSSWDKAHFVLEAVIGRVEFQSTKDRFRHLQQELPSIKRQFLSG